MSIFESFKSNNRLLRCYNMFPTNFKNIEEMTDYLDHLKELNVNVVWINPIQLASACVIDKVNPATGQNLPVKGSLYAMIDDVVIDPRFSVVARDDEGDSVFTPEQHEVIAHLHPCALDQLKNSRESFLDAQKKLNAIEKNITICDKTIAKKMKENADYSSNKKNLDSLVVKRKLQAQVLNSAHDAFHANLISIQNSVQFLDKIALQKFTAKAISRGITPIFDLVLNHVGSDSAIVEEYPELFNPEDRTFPDATPFIYSKLIPSKRSNEISYDEKMKICGQIPKIIEQVWKPFLKRYISDYGFCGVRVDCVRKIPKEVRQPIYKLIRELVDEQAQQKPMTPEVIILEETLFSDLSAQQYVEIVGQAGATHNTGSVYYETRQWHGGLSENYKNEDYFKRTIAQDGVINFTGNHDHYSCAMTVCRELALERLQENTTLYSLYREDLSEREAQASLKNEELSDGARDIILTNYIHYYVNQIIAELRCAEYYNDVVVRFGKSYREKFLTSVFSGSGGYYMLSGDEFCSFNTPSVFIRAKDGKPLNSDAELKIFDSESEELALECIDQMADEAIRRRKANKYYLHASKENQRIMRSPVFHNLFNELNHQSNSTLTSFHKAIKTFNPNISEDNLKQIQKLTSKTVQYSNSCRERWSAPESLSRFCSIDFFKEVNAIVEALPASNIGFWSELFKAVDDNLLIAVRMNAARYEGSADVIIYNVNPYKTVQVTIDDLNKIACWFQQRGFSHQVYEQSVTNPDFHKAYASIMGSSELMRTPATFYFGGRISLDKSIDEYTVNINGELKKITIAVLPKPISQDLLFELNHKISDPKLHDHQLEVYQNVLNLYSAAEDRSNSGDDVDSAKPVVSFKR